MLLALVLLTAGAVTGAKPAGATMLGQQAPPAGGTVPAAVPLTPAPPLIIKPALANPMRSRMACPWPLPAQGATFQYVFPVQPPSAAGYGPEHHDYPATDIFAAPRTHFVAVVNGCVHELSRVDRWDPATNDPALRGGLFVSIIGDDGVRYYGSHLDEVAAGLEPGDRVAAGQLLGYIGRSGNARTTPHHVHFGISYPTYGNDWQVRRGLLSPYPYLLAWARGENLTPDLSTMEPAAP